MGCCVLLPLSPATATIALLILCGFGVVRFGSLCPIWASMFRSPLALAVVGFLGWSALSLTWTVDTAEGWETLRAQRYLLLVPLLLPLALDLRWLVLSILFGVVLQVVAQIAVYVGAIPWSMRPPWQLNGGFSRHPSAVALWAMLSIGAVLSRGLPLSVVWRSLLGLTLMVGLFISGSRTGMLAMAALLPVLLIFGAGIDRKVVGASLSVALLALTVVVVSTDLDPARYVRKAFRSIPEALADEHTISSASVRWALWRAGVDAGLERPIVGWGLGSGPMVTDQHESMIVLRAQRSHEIGSNRRLEGLDMHSSWVGSFVELGLVGVLLYALNMLLLVALAIRLSHYRGAPWGPLAWSVVMMTTVFGVTNVMFNSGHFEAAALMGVMLLLAILAQAQGDEQATVS